MVSSVRSPYHTNCKNYVQKLDPADFWDNDEDYIMNNDEDAGVYIFFLAKICFFRWWWGKILRYIKKMRKEETTEKKGKFSLYPGEKI